MSATHALSGLLVVFLFAAAAAPAAAGYNFSCQGAGVYTCSGTFDMPDGGVCNVTWVDDDADGDWSDSNAVVTYHQCQNPEQ